MCASCGCHAYNEKNMPTDITLDELKEAAAGQRMTMAQCVENMHECLQDVGEE
jgi:hypothetical protein